MLANQAEKQNFMEQLNNSKLTDDLNMQMLMQHWLTI